MKYFLNLFSPETWKAFVSAGCKVSGFSRTQGTQARRTVSRGDVFLCYLVGLGRWCGVLEIESEPYEDVTPLFRPTHDPFVVRFKVRPIIVLEPEFAIPVRNSDIWNRLTWTKNIKPGSVGWGANFQRSLRQVPDQDADYLIKLLRNQDKEKVLFELSQRDKRKMDKVVTVRTTLGEVSVEIPEDRDSEDTTEEGPSEPIEIRESHQIQSLIAEIGFKMGFKLWIPKSDRAKVVAASSVAIEGAFLSLLPMNYNDATIRTVEQIDVIWLRGRSIARAFEIEHTTAIYSGLLRMADLVALQPDINIPLHIVAPESRRELVFDQIRRPVFSLLETGPLSERCSLLSYDDIREIASKQDLSHMRDTVLDDYLGFAEDS